MKKRLILIAMAVTVLATTPFLYAQPGRGFRGHGMHGGPGGDGFGFLGRIERAREELGLTDQQVGQIQAIFSDARAQNAQYRDQLRGGMQEAAAKLLANPNDLAGAQAILDEQAAAEKAMKSNMLTALSKVMNVLTPEQREKAAELMAEHGHRGRRGGR